MQPHRHQLNRHRPVVCRRRMWHRAATRNSATLWTLCVAILILTVIISITTTQTTIGHVLVQELQIYNSAKAAVVVIVKSMTKWMMTWLFWKKRTTHQPHVRRWLMDSNILPLSLHGYTHTSSTFQLSPPTNLLYRLLESLLHWDTVSLSPYKKAPGYLFLVLFPQTHILKSTDSQCCKTLSFFLFSKQK